VKWDLPVDPGKFGGIRGWGEGIGLGIGGIESGRLIGVVRGVPLAGLFRFPRTEIQMEFGLGRPPGWIEERRRGGLRLGQEVEHLVGAPVDEVESVEGETWPGTVAEEAFEV